MIAALLVLLSCGIATWALTPVVQRYALDREVIDVPNHRSSHEVPMPRGGGLAIAAVTLAAFMVAGALHWIDVRLLLAFVGGGSAVAAIGWLDDRNHVAPVVRIAVHLAAALWTVVLLGGFHTLDLGFATIRLGAAGTFLAVLGIGWLVNLYNFMDGIDGLAGSEAVSVGVIAAALLLAAGEPGLAFLAAVVAAAAAGFTTWNWPPARIFMGDVGSGLLGFLFAALTVAAANTGALVAPLFLLLLGVFIFDATVTLFRRIGHGERFYEPHRRHAFQRAVQGGWSHRGVTMIVLALNGILGILAAIGFVWQGLVAPVLVCGAASLCAVYWMVERRCPMFPRGPAVRRERALARETGNRP